VIDQVLLVGFRDDDVAALDQALRRYRT